MIIPPTAAPTPIPALAAVESELFESCVGKGDDDLDTGVATVSDNVDAGRLPAEVDLEPMRDGRGVVVLGAEVIGTDDAPWASCDSGADAGLNAARSDDCHSTIIAFWTTIQAPAVVATLLSIMVPGLVTGDWQWLKFEVVMNGALL